MNSLKADGTSIFAMPDTDGGSYKDFMDIDADNDGILDFLEAQAASIGKVGEGKLASTKQLEIGANQQVDQSSWRPALT
ncbi:hypothetical protein [Rufibacter roseus]|uniref:EF-hand domain-containing protein n=1 Tax=Rufibacter roseus TaxID=1567108 RepID=A0ABW2DHI3_9BACT|nr:hypothetical protein [Rufibacter roseus]